MLSYRVLEANCWLIQGSSWLLWSRLVYSWKYTSLPDHSEIDRTCYETYESIYLMVPPYHYQSNLIRMPKLRCSLIKVQWYILCQRNRSITSHHSKIGGLPYQRKLSHKNTGIFPTVNQPRSQQSARSLNQSIVCL